MARKDEELLRWSTLGFLMCLCAALVIACVWTGSYWSGDSWMARALRSEEGYWAGMSRLLGDGELTLSARFQLWLFVAAPVLSGLGALCALGLAFLQLGGRRVWPLAAGLAVLALLGTWAGMAALHRVEDPYFFARSPWVRSFQGNAYPAAALAGVYLVVLGWAHWRLRGVRASASLAA